MFGKTGLSSLPSPCSRSGLASSALLAITASIRAGWCTVTRSSSVASGAGTVGSRSSTPSSRASATVRSTRTGFIGWAAPKL